MRSQEAICDWLKRKHRTSSKARVRTGVTLRPPRRKSAPPQSGR